MKNLNKKGKVRNVFCYHSLRTKNAELCFPAFILETEAAKRPEVL